MRRILCPRIVYGAIAFLAMVITVPLRGIGATYYVAPTGGNDSSGHGLSVTDPLNTITKAISLSAAGDTIYLLDRSPAANSQPTNFLLSSQLSISKSGNSINPINLFAYPGDKTTPILDFHNETFGGSNNGSPGISLSGSFWHLKGFTEQYAADNGILVSGSNNTLERLVTRQNQDSGLILKGSVGGANPANNLILNSDSYGNFDYLTASGATQGGNADGFAAKFRGLGTGNFFIGDRSYNNSDDGFDLWGADNPIHIINSQAFHNGVSNAFKTSAGAAIPNFGGDGNGIKLGQDSSTHAIFGDVVWGNPHNGFDINGNARDTVGPGIITHGVTVFNNTAFNNGTVSGSNYRFDDTFTSANPTALPHVLQNNVSLSGTINVVAGNVENHNSWDSGFSVTASDFVSTTDPVTDGVFHPAGPTGGDRDGTTTPTYPIVQPRDPVTGNIINTTGFLQLKFGDARANAGTSTITPATGGTVTLTSSPTVLDFTGVTVTIPGFGGTAPALGAYDVPLAGDFNLDGKLSVADISAMLGALTNMNTFQTSHNLTNADMLSLGDWNGDSHVTNADVQSLISTIANYASAGASPGDVPIGGDLPADGAAFNAVPEPASIILLAIALPGIAYAITRRRNLLIV